MLPWIVYGLAVSMSNEMVKAEDCCLQEKKDYSHMLL
jgi:hypothetical protein